MKKLLSKIAFLAMAAFAISACNEADEAAEKYDFEYDADKLEITFAAEPTVNSETFTFTSYLAWTVELVADESNDDLDWVSVDPKEGAVGASTITIEVDDNDTYSSRTCYAVISAGTYEVKVTVNQKGLVNTLSTKDVYGFELDYTGDAVADCSWEINYWGVEADYSGICYMGYDGVDDPEFEVDYGDENLGHETSDDEVSVYDVKIGDLYYKLENGKAVRFLSCEIFDYSIGTISYDGDYISEVNINYYDNDSYNEVTRSYKYECTWSGGNLTKVEGYVKELSGSFESEGYAEFTYSNIMMNTNVDLNELMIIEFSSGRAGEFVGRFLPLRSMGFLGENSPLLLSKIVDNYGSGSGESTVTLSATTDNEGYITKIECSNDNENDYTFTVDYTE